MGAIQSEATGSAFDLGSLIPMNATPAVFMPAYPVIAEMQGKQPACGAHAGAIVANILDGTGFRGSPEYLWDKIKLIDGFAVEDGTDLASILKTLANKGICSFSMLPNHADIETLAQYADASKITQAMDADASKHTVMPAYAFTWSPTLQDLKDAVYTHKAVILLMRIGAEFWTPSWSEKDILPLKTTFPIISGHFVTAYAYDEQYVYFYNHWSQSWGRQGIGYFTQDYMPRIMEMGTVLDVMSYVFARNLKLGDTGTDVGILQLFLKKMGFFTAGVTSYYGPVTQAAVKAMQEKYSDFVLVPAGINTKIGTGNFADHTRDFLNTVDRSKLLPTNIK